MAFSCCCSLAHSACLLLAPQGQQNAAQPLLTKMLSLSSFPSFPPTALCSQQEGVGVCPQPFGFPVAFKMLFLLTLACERIACAWASWADTTGPFSPSPPKRNCWTHTDSAFCSAHSVITTQYPKNDLGYGYMISLDGM